MNDGMVVFGASGFLGRHFVAAAASRGGVLRAVTRRAEPPAMSSDVEWIQADLAVPASLDRALHEAATVVNLAYAPHLSAAQNLQAVDNLISACRQRKVKRLVHCSTAVVAGTTPAHCVAEDTDCLPATPYERCKWAIEQRVVAAGRTGLDVVVLRPTAIVGPGGANLASLARNLVVGSALVNYCRRSLYADRQMHLVPVSTVVAAIVHAAHMPDHMAGEAFIVAADDDADNRFSSVEAILRAALGVAAVRMPAIPVARDLLSMALRLRGRSDLGQDRLYSWEKLRLTGFAPTETIADAVHGYGVWFRKHQA